MQAHHVQGPVAAEIKELISSIVTPDGRCNYVSPAGEACLKTRHIEDRSQARHWLTRHVAEELRYLIVNKFSMSQLPMSRVQILTTEARFRAALKYATWCPNNNCQKTDVTQFFIRADELKTHRQRCALKDNPGLTEEQIDDWADTYMALCHGARKYESPYYEPIRRILQA